MATLKATIELQLSAWPIKLSERLKWLVSLENLIQENGTGRSIPYDNKQICCCSFKIIVL